jgi:hypothetical protein
MTTQIKNFYSFIEKLFRREENLENLTGIELENMKKERIEKLIKKAKTKLKENQEAIEIKGKVYIKTYHDDLYLNFDKLKEHVWGIGKTGVGKSVFLKRVARSLLKFRSENPGLKKLKKMIINDVKGDFIQEFYDEKDFILINPFDERGYGIDIFSLIKVETDISLILNSVVPDNPKTDPIWVQSPRQILESAIYTCLRTGKKTNKELARILKLPSKLMLKEFSYINIDEEGKKQRVPYKGCETGFQHLNSSQGDNLLSGAISYFEVFYALGNSKKNINIEDYLLNEERNLLLANFSKIREKIAPIFSLFINQLCYMAMDLKEDPDRNIVLILDEFSSLKKMDTIADILQKGRSFGLSLIILLQEFGPVDQIYGKEMRQSFFNNTGVKLFFQVTDNETIEAIQKYIGTQTVRERSENHSAGDTENKDGYSSNYQIQTKNALRDGTTLQGLNKHEFFYSETEVSDSKEGNTYIYTGRIKGFINPEIDIRTKLAVHFIIKKELELSNFSKELIDELNEIEKTEVNENETISTNEVSKNRTNTTTNKEELKNSIKEKYNNIKLAKGGSANPPNLDLDDEELSDNELDDDPWV